MYRTLWPRLVAALVIMATTACSPAPHKPLELAPGDYSYVRDHLRWYIAQQMKKNHVPGVSIALVDDQTLVWAEGFGYADTAQRIPASAKTVYQVGSISKLFTATAAMQLVEQGRLDLDAPLQRYLPTFSIQSRWPTTPALTARGLLSHHAGLPTYHLKGFFSNQPLGELIPALQREHLAYAPYSVFNYSNLGPNLIGLAMERLSTEPFDQYMQQALLDPLGMQHSAFSKQPHLLPHLARGYVEGKAVETVTVRDVPAGGLYSNVQDLSQFMRFVFAQGRWQGKQVLSSRHLQSMFEPQYPDLPLDFGQEFGLGWLLSGINLHGAGPVAWHNGGTKAYLSQMVLLPEKKLGVVVLANSHSAGNLVYDVAEEALKKMLEARDGITQPQPEDPAPVSVTRASLQGYTGDYSLMGALAHVYLDGEHLIFEALGHKLHLVPLSETRFRAEFRLFGWLTLARPLPPIEFTHVDGRQFMLIHSPIISPAEKIPTYTIPEAWRKRVGDYRLTNADADFLVDMDHCRMLVENGRLLLDLKISGLEDRSVKVVVVPLSDQDAYVFGQGRNVGDVTQVEYDGENTRMRYSGYIFERQGNNSGQHLYSYKNPQ